MQQPFDMMLAPHRALFVFAVLNLLRWFTLMAKGLPQKRFRIQLLETWRRSSHVTITFQPGGRYSIWSGLLMVHTAQGYFKA
jgi:hypothetical protein